MPSWSPSGLSTVPHLHWGSHLAHFFNSSDELRDVLIPYFRAGLDNGEQCLWITGPSFTADQARAALHAAVGDLAERESRHQIEIVDGDDWYTTPQGSAPGDLVNKLVQRERDALGRGYAGLRVSGHGPRPSRAQRAHALEYEMLFQEAIRGRRVICLCGLCIDQPGDDWPVELLEIHDMTIPSAARSALLREGKRGRSLIEISEQVQALRDFERRVRTFDLAMKASSMGIWRYALADNVCVYDENAQRLYGLAEARIEHDEAGVKAMFHPDDLDLMWSRVAKALDPAGDGRYEAEYRVRQGDGSWRWLSAWGLVEFEGEGPERTAVAIAGASRDLTERKQSEDLQRLLLDDLHRHFNTTLATVQALKG